MREFAAPKASVRTLFRFSPSQRARRLRSDGEGGSWRGSQGLGCNSTDKKTLSEGVVPRQALVYGRFMTWVLVILASFARGGSLLGHNTSVSRLEGLETISTITTTTTTTRGRVRNNNNTLERYSTIESQLVVRL